MRPAVSPEVAERRLTSGYIAPARVHLGRKDDAPVPADVAARLARLFELHGAGLVRYLCTRIGWGRRALAEDLVQEVWLDLAMRPEQMTAWDGADEDLFGLLAYRAKQQVHRYLRLMSNEREQALGAAGDGREVEERLEALAGPGPDTTVCAVLELLGEEDRTPGWRACFADAVAALPDAHREVLELACVEGMALRVIADRLGLSQASVQDRYRRALEALRPALEARPQRDANGLPAGWESAVGALTGHQEKVVRLRAQGRSQQAIAAEIGSNSGVVCRTLQRAVYRMELRLLADRQEQPQVRADRIVPDPQVVAELHAARSEKQHNSGLPEGWEQIVDRLARSAADVVRMRAAEGLPFKEIARRLERSKHGVETSFHSAARSLRKMAADRRKDPMTSGGVVRVPAPAPANTARQESACHFARACAAVCSLRKSQVGAGVAS